MRIALRTSGGRGEYEAAGTHENTKVHDIFDRQITLELLPGLRIHTQNLVKKAQGKPRIRLSDQKKDSHIYLILAAVLLLPKPKRQIGQTPEGKMQVYKDNYSVYSIPFDIVELNKSELVIAPTQLILANSSLDSVRVDIIERFKIIFACWASAKNSTSNLARALLAHRDAVKSGNVDALLKACNVIRLSEAELDDPLTHVTKELDLPNLDEISWLGIHSTNADEATVMGEENLENFKEAARNRIKSWRLIASRGSAGAIFSGAVKDAYKNTCLFTGMRLPKIDQTGSSGVDAAHILPWAEYDLNIVSNGLCLNKLCHWAFDVGILKLEFQAASDKYNLSLSKSALEAESQGLIDLGSLRDLQGVVSSSLLPKDRANWPNPSFLNVYNEALNF
jgi:hypothetical protein